MTHREPPPPAQPPPPPPAAAAAAAAVSPTAPPPTICALVFLLSCIITNIFTLLFLPFFPFPVSSFGGDGGCALLRSLGRLATLTELRVDGCELGEAAGIAIGGMVAESEALSILDLSNCAFGEAGGQAVTAGIGKAKQLKELRLMRCGIGASTAAALGAVLAAGNPATLSIVDVSGDDLGNAGCIAIVESLQSNRGVKCLRLWQCGLNDTVATALEAMLAVNTTLVTLCLSCEAVTEAGLQAIAKGLHSNESVREIRVPTSAGVSEELMSGSGVRLTLV
jgi:hypothetical protein